MKTRDLKRKKDAATAAWVRERLPMHIVLRGARYSDSISGNFTRAEAARMVRNFRG